MTDRLPSNPATATSQDLQHGATERTETHGENALTCRALPVCRARFARPTACVTGESGQTQAAVSGDAACVCPLSPATLPDKPPIIVT